MAQWSEHSPPTNVAWTQLKRSIPYVGLSWLLVPSFTLRGFSLGSPVFPSPQKPTFQYSNLTRNGRQRTTLLMCSLSKSLFIIVLSDVKPDGRNLSFS